MKKITLLVTGIISLFFIACEGPQGVPGYDGADGLDAELGKVMDIEGDFTAANDYAILYEFPQTIEVFETDVVLVYILWDQTVDGNGDPVDIWRLLPQTRLLDQGILQYNYDYTFFNVSIFLESDFDLGVLPSGDTQNQVFRIAVLPAESLSSSTINENNIEGVMNLMNLTENDVLKLN